MSHYLTFQFGRLAMICTGYDLCIIGAVLLTLLVIAYRWGRRNRRMSQGAYRGTLQREAELVRKLADAEKTISLARTQRDLADKKLAEMVKRAFQEGQDAGHEAAQDSMRGVLVQFLRDQADFLEKGDLAEVDTAKTSEKTQAVENQYGP